MKCSKLILFIFLFSYAALAIDDSEVVNNLGVATGVENIVLPKNNIEFSNGNITNLIIKSELSDKDLKSLEHSKITEVIYVLSFIKNEHGREFEVVFSDPPTSKSRKKYPFSMRGINYKYDKEKTAKSFNLVETKYAPPKAKDFFLLGVSVFLGLILIIIFYKLICRYTELSSHQRKIKERGVSIIDSFNNAKERKAIEALYRERENLLNFTNINLEKWSKFENVLNRFQYKEKWLKEDLDQVIEAKKEIGILELKNGI